MNTQNKDLDKFIRILRKEINKPISAYENNKSVDDAYLWVLRRITAIRRKLNKLK